MEDSITKKTLLIILPDGITLRNFVFSSFLTKAVTQFQVIIMHYVDKQVFEALDPVLINKVKLIKIDTYSEGFWSKTYRYAKQWSSLKINYKRTKNKTFLRNYPNLKSHSLPSKMPLLLAKYLGRHATQDRVLQLEKLQFEWFKKEKAELLKEMRQLLSSFEVDLVFNVHQRDIKSIPIMVSAKQMNIPTANFVYSWDNLPKGRMANLADYYLVWSEYMKSELNLYYPDIKDSQIYITGTPQFEFYHTYQVTARDEFAKLYGLNPSKEWILYSGDMTDASPYDQFYLEDVYDAWLKSNRNEETELLFRRAPTDLTGRFTKTLGARPEIKVIEPLWNQFGPHQMSLAVSKEDVQLLVDLVAHCSTAVNFGSTMAHDFAQFNKRVYYLNYEHPMNPMDDWTAEIFYSYSHFESMSDLDPVEWIRSKDELYRVFDDNRQIDQRISNWHRRITADTTIASDNILSSLAEMV